MPTWLLTKCHSEFNQIITTIINASLELCQVSNILKSALVTPFLKKAGLSLIFKNVRPVSNLKFISNLIERTVPIQLLEHLSANNAREPMQSAYRADHSTETAPVRVQNYILNAIDNQQVTIMLLLDLSAAFDSVNYSILINRIENCAGVTGKATSESLGTKTGVPQGSVLGPLLFLIYTLPLVLTWKPLICILECCKHLYKYLICNNKDIVRNIASGCLFSRKCFQLLDKLAY